MEKQTVIVPHEGTILNVLYCGAHLLVNMVSESVEAAPENANGIKVILLLCDPHFRRPLPRFHCSSLEATKM
jgi:hypothetical protein